jgi:hypothetical protein
MKLGQLETLLSVYQAGRISNYTDAWLRQLINATSPVTPQSN